MVTPPAEPALQVVQDVCAPGEALLLLGEVVLVVGVGLPVVAV